MIVQIQGKKLSLDPSSVLGAGGEATVFGLDEHTAIKVFHTPSKDRELKLNAALQRAWPAAVVAPRALVHDARGAKVVGFTMRRAAPDLEPLSSLFRRSARRASGLKTLDVVDVLRSLARSLDSLHQAGVVVGDLNDQNELWARTKTVELIDADSFQHDGLPCLVATESYLAPELYGVDLSARPCFTPAHDRYAFAVLAFRALLCVHPFGGTHATINSLPDRVARRLWVLDPSVRYPDKIALPAQTLSAPLLAYFHAVFVDGSRPPLPIAELSDHAASISACSSCGEEAPRSLSTCPVCATARPKPARRTTNTRCLGELLTFTEGAFLCAGIARDRSDAVLAIADESGDTVVHIAEAGRIARRTSLGPRDARDRFAILDLGLVVRARGDRVDIIDPESAAILCSTSTALFGGLPAFAASGAQLVRIAAGVVLRGALRGDTLVERTVGTALDQQTWLSSASTADHILGAHRVFRNTQPFRIDRSGYLELAAPALADHEALEDLTLQSDGSNTLLLRATREKGIGFTRIDLFDRAGSLACSSKVRADADPTRVSIHGRAFRGDVILHPTDDGIVHESLRFGSIGDLKLLDDTEPFVSSQATLLHHPRGLLSLGSSQLVLLTPR